MKARLKESTSFDELKLLQLLIALGMKFLSFRNLTCRVRHIAFCSMQVTLRVLGTLRDENDNDDEDMVNYPSKKAHAL